MNRGRWFGPIALVLLVGAVVWFLSGAATDPGSVAVPSGSASQSAQTEDPGSGKPAGRRVALENSAAKSVEAGRDAPSSSFEHPDSRLAVMRKVETAHSALAREEALERLAETDPVLAARKLHELSQFCAPKHIRAQEQVNDSPELIEQRRQWCAGLELSAEAMKSRLDELMRIDAELEGQAAQIERLARDPYVGRRYELEEDLAGAEDAGRSDRFSQLLRRATSLEELMTLSRINRQHAVENSGRPLWRLGIEQHRRAYPQAKLLEAQGVAIMLYGCRRIGGCGGGHYITMTACTVGWFGRCAPGSSLEEQIYLTTPPATYSLALEILTRLHG